MRTELTPRTDRQGHHPEGVSLSEDSFQIDRMIAIANKLAVDPVIQMTESIAAHHLLPEYLNSGDVEELLSADISAIIDKRDFTCLEKLLFGQAVTLNNVFHTMIQKAAQADLKLEQMKGFMELALRMQKQSRSTMELLRNLQNPSGVFIQQNSADKMMVNVTAVKPTNELSDKEIIDAQNLD